VEVRFRTSRFNLSQVLEPVPEGGIFGHDAAAWLRWELLLRGVEAAPPARRAQPTQQAQPARRAQPTRRTQQNQRDSGWFVEAALGEHRYRLWLHGVSAGDAADPDRGQWCIAIHKHRTFWQRLLGWNPLKPAEPCVALVREIAAAEGPLLE
jgi:hypothetical protein